MSEHESETHLPPGMYEGGMVQSARILSELCDTYLLPRPRVIYYPGSSSDVSLLAMEDARVIHADPYLDETMMAGFSALHAEVYCEDAQSWQPPSVVDMIAFINPGGIDERAVVTMTDLRPGGLVLWYFWAGRPWQLQETEGLSLVAAISITDEGTYSIDTEDLAEYFRLKTFDELSETEQADFVSRFTQHYKLTAGSSYAAVYAQLQEPEMRRYADALNIASFPYKKETNCFLYQKVAESKNTTA